MCVSLSVSLCRALSKVSLFSTAQQTKRAHVKLFFPPKTESLTIFCLLFFFHLPSPTLSLWAPLSHHCALSFILPVVLTNFPPSLLWLKGKRRREEKKKPGAHDNFRNWIYLLILFWKPVYLFVNVLLLFLLSLPGSSIPRINMKCKCPFKCDVVPSLHYCLFLQRCFFFCYFNETVFTGWFHSILTLFYDSF